MKRVSTRQKADTAVIDAFRAHVLRLAELYERFAAEEPGFRAAADELRATLAALDAGDPVLVTGWQLGPEGDIPVHAMSEHFRLYPDGRIELADEVPA